MDDDKRLEAVAEAIATEQLLANYKATSDLLAAAAIEAVDQYGIDAMLDKVHPLAQLETVFDVESGFDGDELHEGEWWAHLSWPTGGVAPGTESDDDWGNAEGTGPTRQEAITDACRKAEEHQNND